jgi:hypothetical protein
MSDFQRKQDAAPRKDRTGSRSDRIDGSLNSTSKVQLNWASRKGPGRYCSRFPIPRPLMPDFQRKQDAAPRKYRTGSRSDRIDGSLNSTSKVQLNWASRKGPGRYCSRFPIRRPRMQTFLVTQLGSRRGSLPPTLRISSTHGAERLLHRGLIHRKSKCVLTGLPQAWLRAWLLPPATPLQ